MMDYRTLKLTELKNIAKEKGIHGVSTLRKEELVQRLEKADTENTQRAVRRRQIGAGLEKARSGGRKPGCS